MDSTVSVSKLTASLMPFTAILRHDLRLLLTSWLVRLWLLATALLAAFQIMGNWQQLQTAPLIAALLFPYLIFPWSLVVIVLSASPVTGSRAEVAADGVLSRPVTRHAYLLAAWTARVVLVLSVFLIVMVPAIAAMAFAERPPAKDEVTFYGVSAALLVVGLVLTFLVSVGFLLGTLLRNTLLAVVVLVFVWFPVNLVLNTFSLEEFSPISLTQALPTLLRTPWHEAAEEQKTTDVDTALQDALKFFGALASGPQPQQPEARPGFFERGEEFQDFSLLRVVLGYSIPALVAVALATLCFYLRDV